MSRPCGMYDNVDGWGQHRNVRIALPCFNIILHNERNDFPLYVLLISRERINFKKDEHHQENVVWLVELIANQVLIILNTCEAIIYKSM